MIPVILSVAMLVGDSIPVAHADLIILNEAVDIVTDGRGRGLYEKKTLREFILLDYDWDQEDYSATGKVLDMSAKLEVNRRGKSWWLQYEDGEEGWKIVVGKRFQYRITYSNQDLGIPANKPNVKSASN
jgi:hypothetical protein